MSGYHRCRFCGGRGCLACPGEQEKTAKKSLEPIFVIKTPDDMALAASFLGRDAIERGDNLEQNAAIASVLQAMRESKPPLPRP